MFLVIISSPQKKDRAASPSFPTFGEAYHFAKIFGLSGFCLIEMRSFFVGESDAMRRQDLLDHLALGRKVYDLLIEHLPENPDEETLRQLALSLRLENYALPQFRNGYAEVGGA